MGRRGRAWTRAHAARIKRKVKRYYVAQPAQYATQSPEEPDPRRIGKVAAARVSCSCVMCTERDADAQELRMQHWRQEADQELAEDLEENLIEQRRQTLCGTPWDFCETKTAMCVYRGGDQVDA